ncbi:MAG: hypothetical protein AYK23_03605 [Candidatus Proteinoplasmatales archaeon SG8-5]|nr:MAG: hypothetical protein AYK23_03605 [Candidatus Proteinoplasmatales archaeon SG8-5]
MEYRVRFEKLCKQLDRQLCESLSDHKGDDMLSNSKKQNEKELLDAMEKAIEEGNLKDAMRYQFMLEILG